MMLLSTLGALFFRWGYGFLLLIICSALQRFTSRSLLLPNFLPELQGNRASSTSVPSLQSNNSVFDWSDLDLTQRASCGMSKCFFPSKRSDDDEGYLIQHSKSNQSKTHQKWLRTWERAEEMTSRYNETRHFLLDAPVMPENPPLPLLERMNDMVFGPGRTNDHYFGKAKGYNATRQSKSNAGFVVQRVRTAPNPSFICRCYFFSRKSAKRGEEGRFKFDGLSVSTDNFRLAVPDEKAFMSTFKVELQRTIRLLADERYKGLFKDFQFLLDVQGRIHHIDLDRMEEKTFRYPSKKGAKQCFDGALSKLTRVLNGEYTYSGLENFERKGR